VLRRAHSAHLVITVARQFNLRQVRDSSKCAPENTGRLGAQGAHIAGRRIHETALGVEHRHTNSLPGARLLAALRRVVADEPDLWARTHADCSGNVSPHVPVRRAALYKGQGGPEPQSAAATAQAPLGSPAGPLWYSLPTVPPDTRLRAPQGSMPSLQAARPLSLTALLLPTLNACLGATRRSRRTPAGAGGRPRRHPGPWGRCRWRCRS